MGAAMTLIVGDLVQVRSKEQILATLDQHGRLNGLPFMPQMFKYCGQQFKVHKSAHKTCDTVNGLRGRKLDGVVHLDIRCDGSTYGGCQAGCLLYWKEEWLEKTTEPAARRWPDPPTGKGCTLDDVVGATSTTRNGRTIYHCQAVELLNFTKPLPWWDVRQYVNDYTRGNVNLRDLLNGFVYSTYTTTSRAYFPKIGRPGRWLYDKVQSLRGGLPYPRKQGTLPAGQRAPVDDLRLQPGDWVRVKNYTEILETLNLGNTNRGLYFDAEMVPFCGGIYKVRTRIEQFVDEKTGELKSLKTPAVVLEGVWCQGCYSGHRMFCPRSLYCWWREVWLERVQRPTR
jgi:hypothetical protein